MAKRLTDIAIEKAKPDPAKRREIPDGGLPGLYLVIQKGGRKSWAVRYRLHDRPVKQTLGLYPTISLAEARTMARDIRNLADAGIDPRRELDKDVQAGPESFEVLANDFIARYVSKKKSGAETERIIRRELIPAWGYREPASIAKRDVNDLLDRVVDRGAPVMANRMLSATRKLFNWAVGRGRLDVSPCTGVEPPEEERSRKRVLINSEKPELSDELRAFWWATSEIGPPFGPLFRIMLLTGQRRGEVAGMRFEELHGARWIIPGIRTKNGEEHAVHLPETVLLELAKVPRIKGGYVFSTTGNTPVSGFSKPKRRLDGLMATQLGRELEPWRLHDLRRTFYTGCASLDISITVTEKAINHLSGTTSGIVAVYNQHSYEKETRAAWEAWSALVLEIVGEAPGNVVPMEGARTDG